MFPMLFYNVNVNALLSGGNRFWRRIKQVGTNESVVFYDFTNLFSWKNDFFLDCFL